MTADTPLTEAMTEVTRGLVPVHRRDPLLTALREVETLARRVPELERRILSLERKLTTPGV